MMSGQPSLFQLLVTCVPILLLWSSSFRAQAQVIAKCWVFSPVVDEATIRAEVSTYSSMAPTSGRQIWSVSARLTWQRPPSLDSHGAYAVSVVRMPSFKTPQFCSMEDNEILVETEDHTFTDLDFGFLYEFTVYVVNGSTMAKSLVGTTKGFGTPDCYQATADLDFCTTAVVQFAGAPIEPRLESQCLQNDSLITAHLSWDPPIQVNGDISAYKVQFTPPDAPRGSLPEVETAIPDPTSPGGKVMADMSGLTSGSSYTMLISAFVVSLEDGSFNEGLQVELTFKTAGAKANIPVCPPPVVTTPPGVGFNRLQTTDFINPAPATPRSSPMQTPAESPSVDANPPPQQPTQASKPATTAAMPRKPTPPRGGTNSKPVPVVTGPTNPGEATPASTSENDVTEKPVGSSKKAGVVIAACLVALGIICAVTMLLLHLLRDRIGGNKSSASRPDTNGAQKGKKTTSSPA